MALGELVLNGRENLVAIQPSGKGLLLETLRAADEVKNASGYFSEIEAGEVDEDQLELARELIKRKTAPFDPTKFKDDYETALRELIEAKVKHREVREPDSAAPQAKVVDLMDALRRSLAVDKPPRGAPAEVRKLPARQKAKESAGGKPAPRRSKSG